MRLSKNNILNEKKVVFLSSFSYPSTFAHPTHGLHTARGFSKILGEKFIFVVNYVEDKKILEGINFYESFPKLGKLLTKLHLRTPAYFFWTTFFLIPFLKGRKRKVWFFLNDPRLASITIILKSIFNLGIIFESHGFYNRFYRFVIFNFADKFVFVTNGLRTKINNLHKNTRSKSVVLSNAVDIDRFNNVVDDKSVLRKQLSLPEEKIIVGYVGRLKPLGLEKGAKNLISALQYLPEKYILCCVGGSGDEIIEYSVIAKDKKLESRVIFIPYVDTDLVPVYCKSFDVLAYVPPGDNVFFEEETSPMKLFEYMASKRPIIVSDINTTREILDESCAFFVSSIPTDKEIADVIVEITSNQVVLAEKIQESFKRVSLNTWVNRAKNIDIFLES